MKLKRECRYPLSAIPWLVLIALLFAGCGTGMYPATATRVMKQLENQWGVRPVALRLIGGGHFIDFRYQVIDPDKAAELLSRNNPPYLIDEATGKVHTVPLTKLGPMRASAIKPKADRNYVVLFGNTRKIIRKGSMVTVVIGEFRAGHMKVM